MQSVFLNIKDYFTKKTDSVFWFVSVFISVYCLVLLASVSRTGSNYFFVQIIAVIAGYVGAFILSNINYYKIANYWQVTAVICLGLIFLTLVFGIKVEGSSGVEARAWLKLPGGMTFQPSELAKIGFIITFSKHLYYLKQNNLIKNFFHVMFLGIHALIPIILTHLQKDDGAGIIFFCMFLIMCFAAGVQARYFLGMLLVIAICIPFAWKFIFSEYQKLRILAIMDLEKYYNNIGFQQIQGMISIGSGGILGQGLFKGPRVGYRAVPIQESDFIFSVAGEELGFVGCCAILLLLLLLFIRTLQIAFKARDDLGYYICLGFFSMIFAQTVFNLGMCLNILPVIGVTLPFFSAGGSSAACLYLGLGLVQSVFAKREDLYSINIANLI